MTPHECIGRLMELPGWLLPESAINIATILSNQPAGDILEIGSYRGRCSALLLYWLRQSETLYINDLFAAPTDGGDGFAPAERQQDVTSFWIGNPPLTEDQLLETLAPFGDTNRVVTIKGESSLLSRKLPSTIRFRFIHVDGSHTKLDALSDLIYASDHLLNGGAIALDDWMNPAWPEVGEALDCFLDKNHDWGITKEDPGKCYLQRT